MSEWKRGATLSENKNEWKNKNKNKNRNKGSEFSRSKSFEHYKNNKNQNNQNQYNPNYNKNYDLTRSVSFDIHNLNRQTKLEPLNTKNRIIVPLSDTPVEVETLGSKWREIAQKKDEQFKEFINEKDPQYWNGPYWIGPMTIKVEKKKTKGYENYMNILKNAEVQPSTIIMPLCKKRYSRNNRDWYDSVEETYSKEELEAIKEYEFQMKNDKYAIWCEMNYQRRKQESEKYYYETGQLDSFAIVEKEHAEYEEYLKKLEQEEEEMMYNQYPSDDEV